MNGCSTEFWRQYQIYNQHFPFGFREHPKPLGPFLLCGGFSKKSFRSLSQLQDKENVTTNAKPSEDN